MTPEEIRAKHVGRGKNAAMQRILRDMSRSGLTLEELTEYANAKPETTRDIIQRHRTKAVALKQNEANLKLARETRRNNIQTKLAKAASSTDETSE